jgi:hypothetical protein
VRWYASPAEFDLAGESVERGSKTNAIYAEVARVCSSGTKEQKMTIIFHPSLQREKQRFGSQVYLMFDAI